MGDDLYGTLERGLGEEPPVSIRLNPFKAGECASTICPTLHPKQVGWCSQGYWIDSRPNFTFDPLLHAGYYYVQEAASMFLHFILTHTVKEPVLALDLCAAPGGKSTVARTVLPEGSMLICNEPIRQRAQVLSENLLKFGHPDVMVTNNYPRDFQKAGLLFDVIIADVPCSGEGMFRKDAGAIDEWSLQNVENCRLLQREIIEDIWPCLKMGGTLVYSTCTFNAKENEENMAWIEELGAEPIWLEIPSQWPIMGALTGRCPAFRFIPGVTRTEGLCMTVLHKTGGEVLTPHRSKEERSKTKAMPKVKMADWLTDAAHYTLVGDANEAEAIATEWLGAYRQVVRHLRPLHTGIPLATAKGSSLIPHHGLALSSRLRAEAFVRAEVDWAQAIAYLRKEAITLSPDVPRGIVLLTYHGAPIGFVKNLGNRANNLYPQEWRIKSTHLPEDIQTILEI